MNTIEFINLSNVLLNFKTETTVNKLMTSLNEHEFFNKIQDKTSLSFDRCLTLELELLKENKLIRLVLEISVIFPYYFIYATENDIQINPYRWLTLPKRNKKLEKKYFSEINKLKEIIEFETGYCLIPENVKNIKIDDLFFQDVEEGNFTVYNALFKDEQI